MDAKNDTHENIVQLFFITNRIKEQLDNMTDDSDLKIVLNIYNKVKELVGKISPDQLSNSINLLSNVISSILKNNADDAQSLFKDKANRSSLCGSKKSRVSWPENL